MARPTKSIAVTSKMMTKEDRAKREKVEKSFMNGKDKLKPELHLTSRQIKIFKFLTEELELSNILTNLDKYIVSETAVIIDRINEVESICNQEGIYIRDVDGTLKPNPLLRLRDSYMKDYFRCCNELCLSPQSRAKMGVMAMKKAEEDNDSLLKILRG